MQAQNLSTAAGYSPETIREISAIYDERECRLACQLGREINHQERVNLATKGVLAFFVGAPVCRVELAIMRAEFQLKKGETVGAALSVALKGE